MAKAIAFYLPQFYPTPENDQWWGKGFTEWTNVGRAKPLFRGHYQPRVPADLGYYDLRIPEVRVQQANLAREAGIYGFCYWHYWFSGQRLLDKVFEEVVNTGDPDFPFCLCWANHSWKAKTWDPAVPDKMLVEQTYPGKEDYIAHFNAMLPAFIDKRYIKHEGKLLFGVFDPVGIPSIEEMASVWNSLAQENGLPGFCFFGFAQGRKSYNESKDSGFDIMVYDAMFDSVFIRNEKLFSKLKAKLATTFNRPLPLQYDFYTDVALRTFKALPEVVPCVDPNFDHSPRSGAKGVILHDSTPTKWGKFYKTVKSLVDSRGDDGLLFVKAWNEWGEGNYLEPDLKYGKGYLEEMV